MGYQVLELERSRLAGVVNVSGAKNSALRLLAASLLTSDPISLKNYPEELLDARIHVQMLELLGKKASHLASDEITIREAEGPAVTRLQWEGRSIRNTLLILGALVARRGQGAVPLPGGCQLGDRKYDLHIAVLEGLGARVWEEGGYLCAEVSGGLKGAEIHLPIRSTGATENAILCGVLAQGTTNIWNPHVRPEILDLIAMLNSMGARIAVHGQERIEIKGVDGLSGVRHSVIPDNMEAITWLVAAAMTKGDVEIVDFPSGDLAVVLAHLKAAGAQIYDGERSVIVRGGTCYPIDISTGPHPGINSDVQPILAAWASTSRGLSKIVDLRFPGRYGYAEEMAKMGLSYDVRGDILNISGNGGRLIGAEVRALDLRAGAALSLCGLVADGVTRILDAWQVNRGYVRFPEKLRGLGAVVREFS